MFSEQSAKGFLLLTLTHEDAKAELMTVSTIASKTFETKVLKTFRVTPEARRVSGLSEV